jgi:hypothetical protein
VASDVGICQQAGDEVCWSRHFSCSPVGLGCTVTGLSYPLYAFCVVLRDVRLIALKIVYGLEADGQCIAFAAVEPAIVYRISISVAVFIFTTEIANKNASRLDNDWLSYRSHQMSSLETFHL